MIFVRYLTKNMILSFAITTMVLVVILASNLTVRLLTDIHEEGIYGGYLLPLIFFNLLDDMPLLLPLCLFIGIYLALIKLHRNQEIIAMQALGVGFKELFQSVIIIAIPVCIFVAILSLYVSPLSMTLNNQYRNEYDLSNQLKSLVSQSFALSSNSRHVIYVDENNQLLASNSQDEQWPMKSVFIYSDFPNVLQERVIVAEKGRQNTKVDNGVENRYLVLGNGETYTFKNGILTETLKFNRYDVVLATRNNQLNNSEKLSTLPTQKLMTSDNKWHQSEFYWRLSPPFSLIMAGLLALAMANFKPRSQSFKQLFIGILIYIVYHNILNTARYWSVNSSFSVGLVFLLIHFLAFLLITLFLLKQRGYLKIRLKKNEIN